ncbi:hypothetical protein EG367_14840 [Listeria monocytogenes]|nr:hypothetical protein [Listeria monocytogenes]
MANKKLVCEFLFIEKNMNPSEFFLKHFDLQKDVESHQQGSVIEITFPSIQFNYKNQVYVLPYNEKELNDNVYSISIALSYENNKEKHALILDKVISHINKKRNQNFSLIFTRNDSLKYFSIRLYKLLYDFETNLRSLIKIMLIPDNKEEWYKAITSKVNVRTNLSNISKIEKIIEELSITDLELLLFGKEFPSDSNLFEEELSRKQVQELSKQEIIHIININRPVSLWDTYFSNFIEYDVMSAMKIIKASRNNVAHYREFGSEEYTKTIKVLNEVNPLIKDTIERLQSLEGDVVLEMSLEVQKKAIGALKNIAIGTTKIVSVFADLQKNILKDISNNLNSFKDMRFYDEE